MMMRRRTMMMMMIIIIIISTFINSARVTQCHNGAGWRWWWWWWWWCWWCIDLINMKVTLDGQLRRCADNRSVWLDLVTSEAVLDNNSHNSSPTTAPVSVPVTPHVTAAASAPQQAPKLSPVTLTNPINPSHNGPMPTMTFNCIADSLVWVSRGRDARLLNGESTEVLIQGLPQCLQSADHIQVLCVGSLHLVGDVLSLLDPLICDKWTISTNKYISCLRSFLSFHVLVGSVIDETSGVVAHSFC